MTDQHRATPEQEINELISVTVYGPDGGDTPTVASAWEVAKLISALTARVEALEAKYETQRLATLEWGKDVDSHGRWIDDCLKRIMALEARQKILSGPESPLVERVADAIAAEATSAGIVNDRPARAAIREVAAWMRQNEIGYAAAAWLEREAKL